MKTIAKLEVHDIFKTKNGKTVVAARLLSGGPLSSEEIIGRKISFLLRDEKKIADIINIEIGFTRPFQRKVVNDGDNFAMMLGAGENEIDVSKYRASDHIVAEITD